MEYLGLDPEHGFQGFDVLNRNLPVALVDGAVEIKNEPPESVRVIKLTDSVMPLAKKRSIRSGLHMDLGPRGCAMGL
jgi:hypothetical protein